MFAVTCKICAANFRISQYKKSVQEIWDEQWCKVDLTLHSGNWLDYEITSDILLSYEVEELRNKLSALLSNKDVSLKSNIITINPVIKHKIALYTI